MALLDTHKVIEELIHSGIKKSQAEVITRAISQGNDNLVTKSDLRANLAELRAELKEDASELKTDMKWIKGLIFLILGLIVGLWFK